MSVANKQRNTNQLLLNYRDACLYQSDLQLLQSETEWLNDACLHFYLQRLNHIDRNSSNNNNNDNLREYLCVDPSVVFFLMHHCSDDDEEDLLGLYHSWNVRKRLLIPMNNHFDTTSRNSSSSVPRSSDAVGTHWSLLVLLLLPATESGRILVGLHFDSCQGSNLRAANAVADKVKKVIHLGSSSFSVSSKKNEKVLKSVVVECQTPQQTNSYDCGLYTLAAAEAFCYNSTTTLDGNNDATIKPGEFTTNVRIDALKQTYETILQSFVETRGGGDKDGHECARNMRRMILDDVLSLCRQSQPI